MLFSAPGEGREAGGDRAAGARRGGARRAVRRDGGVPPHAAAISRLARACRARAAACRCTSIAARAGRIPPAARSSRSLSCAVDGLSAKRFDEYLSLGQVPQCDRPAPSRGRHAARRSVCRRGPRGSRRRPTTGSDATRSRRTPPIEPIDSDDEAVVAGTLRSPWKWEELIVESAVVGGRTRDEGKARWRRRLDGLAADFRLPDRGTAEGRAGIGAHRALRARSQEPAHLRQFALPIVDALADWPEQAHVGRVDRAHSARWQRAACSRPDARAADAGGPAARWPTSGRCRSRKRATCCTTASSRSTGSRRARRYGRLFVGTPHQARGRSFRVVLRAGPGRARRAAAAARGSAAARRAAPRDRSRRSSGRTSAARAERLLLKIAIGAATERLYLSYPRLDVGETRARVPSFYALDVMRAITGRVPDHRVLASEAAEEGGASLAWPAPKDPDRAIDDLEHDLASLKPLLDARDPSTVQGHAHYLLGLNESLRRSVISRWARGRSAWSPSDGLIKVAPGTQAALDGSASAAARRTRCRRCSGSPPARTSFCSRRSTVSSRGTSRSRSCAWIR